MPTCQFLELSVLGFSFPGTKQQEERGRGPGGYVDSMGGREGLSGEGKISCDSGSNQLMPITDSQPNRNHARSGSHAWSSASKSRQGIQNICPNVDRPPTPHPSSCPRPAQLFVSSRVQLPRKDGAEGQVIARNIQYKALKIVLTLDNSSMLLKPGSPMTHCP